MKITEIETFETCAPFQAWNSEAHSRYHGPASYRLRAVFVVHTDNGLEGLGETSGPMAPYLEEWIPRLKGTNPVDWLANPYLPCAFSPAIYDLVGKFNDVPAYKLFGPKVRSRVPMAAWTVSQTPSKMAEEVQHAAAAGYTWMKFHTNHFHNVFAQTEAMQAVAPAGFKIHYDLNCDNTVEHVLELARELVRFPIAGAIEDPLQIHDFEGYRLLRQKSPLPIIFHHLPLSGREALLGLADGYMLGHPPAGEVVRRAGLFEAANIPFMNQSVGGNITRALVCHMGAAFPMATLHHVTCTHLWADDVVKERFPIASGTMQVPEAPGLGVTLDRAVLEKWAANKPDPLPRALIRVRYTGQPTAYCRPPVHDMSNPFSGGPGLMDMCRPGYNHPVDLDFWDDDGSAEFARYWEETEGNKVAEEAPAAVAR